MGVHVLPHSDLGFIVRLDDVGVLSNLRKTHREGLSHRPYFFHRDIDLFGNLVVCDVWIRGSILTDFEVEVRIRPRNLNQTAIITKVV